MRPKEEQTLENLDAIVNMWLGIRSAMRVVGNEGLFVDSEAHKAEHIRQDRMNRKKNTSDERQLIQLLRNPTSNHKYRRRPKQRPRPRQRKKELMLRRLASPTQTQLRHLLMPAAKRPRGKARKEVMLPPGSRLLSVVSSFPNERPR